MSHDMAAIAANLRENGYRVTPQRQIILDAVCALGGHVSPDEVIAFVKERMPAINQATIYRTLNFLTAQRILALAHLPDGRLEYELATVRPHHHLICRGCGASLELPPEALDQFRHEVSAQYGFTIDTDHISFYGACASCRA